MVNLPEKLHHTVVERMNHGSMSVSNVLLMWTFKHQVMTSHSGHHFILPEAADVAASIAAESHPSGSCQAAAAGGNAPVQAAAGPSQATSHLRH